MVALWKIKKFLGMEFDLIDAYGQVLEAHQSNCEPIELLPASKDVIKRAILTEALSSKALKNREYLNALMVTFLSLAHFQKGLPKGSLSVEEKLKVESEKQNADRVEVMLKLGPSLKASRAFSEIVSRERQQLASEWQLVFEQAAAAWLKSTDLPGALDASR